jgi:hypothetical protein
MLERLRDMADPKQVGSHFHPLFGEAADEIVSLKEKLAQIAAVCTDNLGDGCNKEMALGFIRQIALQGSDTP